MSKAKSAKPDSSSAAALSANADGCLIRVHAQPGAKRTEVMGMHGDAVKIRIQAPPVDGRANEELARFLAEELGLAKSKVALKKGDSSRSKTFLVYGLSPEEIRHKLKL